MTTRRRRAAVGFDIGGTHVRVCVVDAGGALVTPMVMRAREPNLWAQVARLGTAAIGDASSDGGEAPAVGIAVAGWIDPVSQIVRSSPTIPELVGQRVGSAVTALPGRVFWCNDANAAAYGEWRIGAGAGANTLICVFLGTGVGGGLIINRAPYFGTSGNAGEIGHVAVEPEGVTCPCGSLGCLEQYASGPAILRYVNLRRRADDEYSLPDFSALSIAAAHGDASALAGCRRAGFYLGTSLAGLANVLRPDRILVGGGVAAAAPQIIDQVVDTLSARIMASGGKYPSVVPGALGQTAGCIGAALLAMDGHATE